MPRIAADDELVTYREAARILGRTVRTVHRLRAIGELRPVIFTDRQNAVQVRLRRREVEALRDRRVS